MSELTVEPTATPTASVCCFFDQQFDGGEIRLSAVERAYEAPVMKPVNLQRTHGVTIRLADLQEMVKSYDPAMEAAALNFDHAWGGPAHGWVSKLWMDGEVMWARVEKLSQEAVDGIESGQWPRRSAEFFTSHPVTNGWYFTGLALLGNSPAAIRGLGPGHLMSGRTVHIIDLGAVAPPETSMPNENTPTEPVAPAEPVQLTAAEQEVMQLRARNAELEAGQRLAAARQQLDALGGRVTPAMRRLAEPLLVQLAAAEPKSIQLSAAPGLDASEVSPGEALLALLAAIPEIVPLGAPPIAGAEAEGGARLAADTRSEVERSWHARFGLTDERVLELQQKYPRLAN